MSVASDSGSIVGRGDDLAAIDHVLTETLAGRTSGLALAGEPGIGKTALLREARRRGAAQGFLVLATTASEVERSSPFGLVVDLLDDEPALAPAAPGSTAEAEDGSPALRYRSHQALRAVLASLAAERPVLVVLDDVHWADEESSELLAHLIRRPPDGPVALVCAYRTELAPLRLLHTVSAGARNGTLVALDLEGLTEAAAGELVGHAGGAELRDLYRDSGGNPLYLNELARAARGRLGEDNVPELIQALIAAEVAVASDRARELLRAAAAAGDPFDLDLVEQLAGMEEADALAALDELVNTGLVKGTRVPRRYAFRRPVVRRAVHADAGPGYNIAAHARAAAELERSGAPAAVVASHLARSARPGDERAVDLLVSAARANRSSTPALAAEWLSRALLLLPEDAPRERRVDLLVPGAEALAAVGRIAEAREWVERAFGLLAADGIPPSAELIAELARLDHAATGTGGQRARLEAGLGSAREPQDRLALTLELAIDHWLSRRWEALAEILGAAIGDGVGDPGIRAGSAYALFALGSCESGSVPAAVEAVDAAARIIDALADREVAEGIEGLAALGQAELALGLYEECARHISRAIDLCPPGGESVWPVLLACVRGAAELSLGRLGVAAAAADSAVEDTAGGPLSAGVWAHGFRSWVGVVRGDLDAAIASAREAAVRSEGGSPALFGWVPGACWGLAEIDAGEPAEGRERLIASSGGAELPRVHPSARPGLYERLCSAELALGDVSAAERWVASAESAAASSQLDGHLAEAGAARAALLLAEGDAAAAAAHAHEAAGRFGQLGREVDAGRVSILEARALSAGGDRTLAVQTLERAHADLADRGAGRYRDEAALELRSLGRHVVRRGTRPPSPRGLDSLTEREREVVQLVGSGLRNREVARRLFLSEKTVERHLARIFDKLSVGSRQELALLSDS